MRRDLRLAFAITLTRPLLAAPALLFAALAGLGAGWLTGSIPKAIAVGVAGLFAALAVALLAILVAAIVRGVWSLGLLGLAIALAWLAHPLILIALPTPLAIALAPVSIAASLLLLGFAAGGLEAAARP